MYYDQDAIKEPLAETSVARLSQDVQNQIGSERIPGKTNGNMKAVKFGGNKQCPDTRLQSGNDWEPDTDKRNKRSVWTIPTQGYKEAHFATFPERLVEPCILAGSAVGDTVLDPFSGAGTTGVVALKHQRNYIGIELSPEYVQMSERRLEKVMPLFNREQKQGAGSRAEGTGTEGSAAA